jgi:lysophospholipase L1-like esterase
MSVDKIIAGSGITIQSTGPDGTGDVLVATDGDMSVTNLKPSYQPTILNSITSASQLLFIGDSITYGVYITYPPTQYLPATYRWATQLSQNYGKPEVNLAVPGHRWQDQLTVLYNKYKLEDKPVCPYFMACGVNDISNTDPQNHDAIITDALSTILYATLPSSNIKLLKVGASGVTTTGLWKNNPLFTNFGMCCLSDGKKNSTGTLETTVTGQYIVINFSSLYPDKNNWIVYIDNVKVDIVPQKRRIVGATTPLDFKCWIYDTGSSTTHTVKIVAEITIYSTICVDFIAGFDESQIGTNPIFVAPSYVIQNIPGYSNWQYDYYISYNEGIKKKCRMLRNVYKLPVYFMEDTTDSYDAYGNCTSLDLTNNLPTDGLHPGPTGHTWIKNRIVNFLENGEYVYRNTM